MEANKTIFCGRLVADFKLQFRNLEIECFRFGFSNDSFKSAFRVKK